MSYDVQLKIWFATMLLLCVGSVVYGWIYYNRRDREAKKHQMNRTRP